MWEAAQAGQACAASPGVPARPRSEASKVPKGAKCQETPTVRAPESRAPLRFCILGTSLAPVESWLQPLVALPHPTDFCVWKTAVPTWLHSAAPALDLIGL